MTLIRDFAAADGFGECYDEAKEVFAGEGVVEAANIIGGVNALGGGVEVVGWRQNGNLLGLWNRGEDDSAGRIGVWGDCWGADGAVGWGRGEDRGWHRGGKGCRTSALAAGAGGGRGGGGWVIMGVVGVVVVVVLVRIFHCCDDEGGDAVESRNEGEKGKPECRSLRARPSYTFTLLRLVDKPLVYLVFIAVIGFQ